MNFNLQKTGFISALPYLAMGTMLGIAGYIADLCQVKGYLTTTQVRRYFNCTAFMAQTVFMFLAVYILHPAITVACITIAIGLGAFAWCGFAVNHLDIAPQFAGILMGITNTFGTIPGIVSPLLTGFIVHDRSASQWRIVFYIAAAIYLVGAVIYWFFASGELQPWAVEKVEETEKTEGDQNFNMKGYDNKAKIEDE
jgi:ACS family sodium-dependent inorganic phosphate cotransporter